MCEVYRLWAIEGDEKVKQVLSFAKCDDGVIIAPDIEMYRELKLRLLNGTHTLSCGLAFLSGFQTVKEALADPSFGSFVQDIMLHEIALAIPAKVDPVAAEQFGMQVLDRFSNPFINHQWISITMQYSSKMKMRVIPVLLKYYAEFNKVPAGIAKGFAAFLAFMKPVKKDGNVFYGEWHGQGYPVNDDNAAYFYEQWQKHEASELVPAVLSDLKLWGTDLTKLPGFAGAVSDNMLQIIQE
jgi:tagaturonate reductase